MHWVVLACWAIFLVYWRITARAVKPAQETRADVVVRLWNLLAPPVLGLLFVVSMPRLAVYPFAIRLLHSTLLQAAGTALVVLGLVIAILARRTLAGNWSSTIELKVDHELVTTGPYRLVRHPIYTGILTMALGLALSSGTVGALVFLLLILSYLVFKLRREEALMAEHFPEQYPEYRRATKALLPFVW